MNTPSVSEMEGGKEDQKSKTRFLLPRGSQWGWETRAAFQGQEFGRHQDLLKHLLIPSGCGSWFGAHKGASTRVWTAPCRRTDAGMSDWSWPHHLSWSLHFSPKEFSP